MVGPGIGSSGIDVGPSIRSSGVDIGPGKQSLGRVGLDTKSLGRRSFQLAEAAAQARRAWVEVGLDMKSLGRPVLQPAGWSGGLGKKSRGRGPGKKSLGRGRPRRRESRSTGAPACRLERPRQEEPGPNVWHLQVLD